MFGGLLEKGRKLQLADINLVVTYNRHAFSGSLRGWHNIGGVTRNPGVSYCCEVHVKCPYSGHHEMRTP